MVVVFTDTLVSNMDKLDRAKAEQKKLYISLIPAGEINTREKYLVLKKKILEKQTGSIPSGLTKSPSLHTAAPEVPANFIISASNNGIVSISEEKPTHGIYTVLPTIRRTEFRPNSGQPCTSSQAFDQASKSLTLVTKSFNGSGTLIVVWDSVPGQNASNAEFTDRPGGAVKYYSDATVTGSDYDEHGLACLSQAGGKYAGIAPGAGLAHIPFTLSPQTNLANIEKLLMLLPPKYPVIVASSSALHWDNVNTMTAEEQSGLYEYCTNLDLTIKRLEEKFPYVTFLFAAGNDNVDMCSGNVYNSDSCISCFEWPCTNANGKEYYKLIGARDHDNNRAFYSNFGTCVQDYSYGGPTCLMGYTGFKAINGTSFACPLSAGVLALYNSVNLDKNSDEVYAIARANNFRFDETKIEAGRQSSDNQRLPDTLPDQVDSDNSENLLSKILAFFSTDQGKIVGYVIVGVLVLLFLRFISTSIRKHNDVVEEEKKLLRATLEVAETEKLLLESIRAQKRRRKPRRQQTALRRLSKRGRKISRKGQR